MLRFWAGTATVLCRKNWPVGGLSGWVLLPPASCAMLFMFRSVCTAIVVRPRLCCPLVICSFFAELSKDGLEFLSLLVRDLAGEDFFELALPGLGTSLGTSFGKTSGICFCKN